MKKLIEDNINKKVLNIYHYGSFVYGTNNENSDKDFIVVVEGKENYDNQLNIDGNDYTIYDEESFENKIKLHEISVLECLFLDEKFIEQEDKKFNFELDLQQLRISISAKCSNSYAKARKKLEVEKDFNPLVAKKSLFHVLRILLFGKQIAIYGKIIDYQEANHYFKDIMNIDSNDWKIFKEKYQPIANNLKTDFRIYAPK